MTHEQLKQMIRKRKGSMSWRALGGVMGVAFQDLCSAVKSDDPPKSGVLRALGVEKVVETRYRFIKEN